jgi:hypothetical protein
MTSISLKGNAAYGTANSVTEPVDVARHQPTSAREGQLEDPLPIPEELNLIL